MKKSISTWGLTFTLLGAIAGCSSGGNNGGGGNPAQAALSALAFKGVVANASVAVYALTSTGQKGRMLATGNTDAQGNINIANIAFTGWVLYAITGGVVTDFLGNTSNIDPAFPLYGFAKLATGVPTLFAATFMTTLMFYVLQAELLNGGIGLEQGIQNAERRIALLFGLAAVLTVAPINLAVQTGVSPGDGANAGAAVHGLCELAIVLGVSEMVLMHLLGRDLMDNFLNGLFFGAAIVFGAFTLPLDVWSRFSNSIANFINSPFNVSGLVVAQIVAITTLTSFLFLPFAPHILGMFPRGVRDDRDTMVTIKVNGTANDIDSVDVGGQRVDPGDVSRPDNDTLDVNVRGSLVQSASAGSNGKVPVTVTNSQGLTATDLAALTKLFNDPPTIDTSSLDPKCAASGGGTQVKLTGANLGDDTVAMIGQAGGMFQPAVVTAVGPTSITVCIPPLAPGTYSLELSNPGGTASVSIPVKDRNLDAAATETGTTPKWGGAIRFGSDGSGGQQVDWYSFTDDYTNADQGTSLVRHKRISQASPSVFSDTFNANINRSRCGNQASVLYFNSSGFNFFTKVFDMQDLFSGAGPGSLVFGWDRPTGVTRSTLAGDHWVSFQQWNFLEGWRRHMFGIAQVDPDGIATFTLFCIEVSIVDGETTYDIIGTTFTLDVTDDGHLSGAPVQSIPGLPTFAGWTNGRGDVSIFTMEDTNTFGYGMTLRKDDALDPAQLYGLLGGQFGDISTNSSGETQAGVGLNRITLSLSGAINPALLFDERSQENFDGSVGGFGLEVDSGSVVPASNGALYDAESGLHIGAAYVEGNRRIALIHAAEGNEAAWGLLVGAPMVQTNHSLRGDFNSIEQWTTTGGDGSSFETGTSLAATRRFNNLDAPTVDGHVHNLAGTVQFVSSVGQTVTRDSMRAVTVDALSGVGGEIDIGYAIWGRDAFGFGISDPPPGHPLEGKEPPFFKLRGTLSPDGNTLIGTDGGTGNYSSFFVGNKAGYSGPLDGDWRLGSIGLRYDNSQGGDLSYSAGRGNMNISMDVVTSGGTNFTIVENGSSGAGTWSFGGSVSGGGGFYDWARSDGKTVKIAPNPAGDAFIALVLSADGEHSIWAGTKETNSAPAVGNMAAVGLTYAFTDFAPFPPENRRTTTWLKFYPGGPGQINLTGLSSSFGNDAPTPTLAQLFNVASGSSDSTGGFQFDIGSNTSDGSLSESGVGQTTEDDGSSSVTLRFHIDF